MEYRKELVKKAVKQLPYLTAREQRIIAAHLADLQVKTVKEIAADFGVSPATIYKVEKTAIRRLEILIQEGVGENVT